MPMRLEFDALPVHSLAPAAGQCVLFAGDLHLTPADPATLETALGFFARLTPANTAALIVLGDLVEYWVGRGQAADPEFARILDAVGAVVSRGVPVTFLPGNRDFLLGPQLAARGVTVARDWVRLELPGTGPVLVTHGDLLVTNDRKYQLYRRVVRSGPVRVLAALMPGGVSRRIANRLRRTSARAVAEKSELELRVPDSAIEAVFSRGARTLVYGHVHVPEHRKFAAVGGGATRDVFVTGMWDSTGGVILAFEDGAFALRHSGGEPGA